MASEARRRDVLDVPGHDRVLVTPEGVALHLQLPLVGERIGAFLTDLALIVAALIAMTVVVALVAWATGGRGGEAYVVIWLLGAFVLRSFWFAGFEAGPRGATPGKRRFGLRVAARDGRRLSADAVIARNLLRELEFFLPLSSLAYVAHDGAADAATAVLALGWTLGFALFPLFNRDRLRVGDLVAGTWVVRAPRAALLDDASLAARTALDFTEAQLDAYGVFELQTLEDVLRRATPGAMRRLPGDPVVVVAAAVRTRIGWTGREDDHAFLTAYYNAIRARLERQLLFGRRRRDKSDR